MQLRTSHAHEEGCDREWSVATSAFSGDNRRVQRIHAVRPEKQLFADGSTHYEQLPGTAFELDADLVVLAMGFAGPVKSRLLADPSVDLDGRGNIATDEPHRTAVPGVFAAGDAHRGASLIVWAIPRVAMLRIASIAGCVPSRKSIRNGTRGVLAATAGTS
jgi:glutamate synthase (NADPH/NADH) small chain